MNTDKTHIAFNKPFLPSDIHKYVNEVLASGSMGGNGKYTKLGQAFFQKKWSFDKSLLTTSCTDALELSAMLLNLKDGDEVIMPSYTFASGPQAFIRQGAKIVFADSRPDHPGIDETKIEDLITNRTKVIVPTHYAGIACDMEIIMELANRYQCWVVEDAAQAINATYKGRPLGSIGHLGAMSFHESKNIQCGEGGMLFVNHQPFQNRSEIIWEKGTNRTAFLRGEVDKYSWVDIGSSFLPSDLLAAVLYPQLLQLEEINARRQKIWNQYYEGLRDLEESGYFELPFVPEYAKHNSHIFYIVTHSLSDRTRLIESLQKDNISAVFHYVCLHNSPYYKQKHDGRPVNQAKRFGDCLVRLPLHFELSNGETSSVIEAIRSFFLC